MRLIGLVLLGCVCFAAEQPQIPAEKRIEYWKLRAEIAEANAAFAGSLSADQKHTLEVIRSKSGELRALQQEITKACGAVSADASAEPVCAPAPEKTTQKR